MRLVALSPCSPALSLLLLALSLVFYTRFDSLFYCWSRARSLLLSFTLTAASASTLAMTFSHTHTHIHKHVQAVSEFVVAVSGKTRRRRRWRRRWQRGVRQTTTGALTTLTHTHTHARVVWRNNKTCTHTDTSRDALQWETTKRCGRRCCCCCWHLALNSSLRSSLSSYFLSLLYFSRGFSCKFVVDFFCLAFFFFGFLSNLGLHCVAFLCLDNA